MTAALVAGIQTTMPSRLEGFIASAMRFFLEGDVFTGQDVAAMLGLPPADWTQVLVRLSGGLANAAGGLADREPRLGGILRALKLRYVERLVRGELGGTRTQFRIPVHLHEMWANRT